MKNIAFILLLISTVLVSCGTNEPYAKYKYNYDPDYAWGYAEFFGAYYSDYGIPNNVISLSLFSDSLFVNAAGELEGTGQYLFIEDLFLAPTDTILPVGKYNVGKNGDAFTFYPGEKKNVDEVLYTIGAYIYYIEKNSAFSTVKLIDRGSFTVDNIGSAQKVECNFVLSDSTVLKGTFNTKLPYVDRSLSASSKVPRKKLALKHPITQF